LKLIREVVAVAEDFVPTLAPLLGGTEAVRKLCKMSGALFFLREALHAAQFDTGETA
jgi:hypothetical protein